MKLTIERKKELRKALEHATKRNDTETIQAIAAQGLSLKAEWTAFTVAVTGNHMEAAELFIRSGVNINRQNGQGYTALTFAVMYSDKEMVELLLMHGAAREVKKTYHTPLRTAEQFGRDDVVQLIKFWDNFKKQKVFDELVSADIPIQEEIQVAVL